MQKDLEEEAAPSVSSAYKRLRWISVQEEFHGVEFRSLRLLHPWLGRTAENYGMNVQEIVQQLGDKRSKPDAAILDITGRN
jgi:hypothetical protein